MLPADQLELITAAVDGELSATQTRAFRRLLEASSEARAVYARLKADSDRVRALPRAVPPADLRNKILARIAATPALSRPQPAPLPVRRDLPSWVPAALAASVFLCITAGSFAFFNRSSPPEAVAKYPWSKSLPAAQDAPPAVPSPTAPEALRPDPDAVVHLDVSPVPPLPLPRPVVPETTAVAPPPRGVTPDLIGSPILPKLAPFELIQVRVPFLRTVAELDREDIRQELLDELSREPAPYRFDLFVRDAGRGVEVFQHAAKGVGLTVFADAATLDKLKKKQVSAVVIYTESLSAAELTALFAKVSADDTKFSPRVCDSLHVATPVVRSDENELKSLLGTDVGLFKRAVNGSGGTGQGGDRDKPVSAGTIDSVAKTLTTPPKAGDRFAVLLTWQSAHPSVARTNPAASAELKQYLSKRGPRKPNAVPAVIVIRPVG